MKKLNVYTVYVDDGHDALKITVPAENKKDAERYVEGSGEVIAVKDSELQDIDLGCLTATLRREGWGQMEIDVITRTLQRVGLERVY